MDIETISVAIVPDYPFFGLVGEPVEHKQHPNQQNGLDIYVHVINLETGERCFKKLYESKKGRYFKHTGYSHTYLDDMSGTATVIPFQVSITSKQGRESDG